MLGQTGSGKTSFLNLLCNLQIVQAYGYKGSMDRFREFQDMSLENAQATACQSKTSGATSYDITYGGLQIQLVDTPGFADTRGPDEDKRHVQRIIERLAAIDSVNGILLVINGREARLGVGLKYVLGQVTALLPHTVLQQVLVVYTNTADILDLNFHQDSLKEFFGMVPQHVFNLENPFCRLQKARQLGERLSVDQIAKSLETSFIKANEVVQGVVAVIEDMKPVHSIEFVKLHTLQKEIERNMNNILSEIFCIDEQTKDGKRLLEEIQAANREAKLNSGFLTTQHIPKWILVAVPRHYTLCGVRGCYSNCHGQCNLEKSMSKDVIRTCGAMSEDYCKVCSHKYDLHYHDEVEWQEQIIVESKEDADMKKRFEEAKDLATRKTMAADFIKNKLRQAQEKKEHLCKELTHKVLEFQTVAVSKSYASLLKQQVELVDEHIRAAMQTGADTKGLKEAKSILEHQFQVVQGVQAKIWDSSDTRFKKEWAAKFLKVAPTAPASEVEKAYKAMCMVLHPDKPGGNDEMQKALGRAKEILLNKA